MSRKALIVGVLIGLYFFYMSRTEKTGSVITFPPDGE